MKNKYAFFHIGDERVTLTREEMHLAIDLAFDEPQQQNYLFGFAIVEMDEDAAQHERKYYDTLKTEI